MAPYRPSGRSNRSGRNQSENEVFEGLPVKQWKPQYARVSLAPPVTETVNGEADKWSREPIMPRDAQLLQPWTFELLRRARSGKIGLKRKSPTDMEAMDEDQPDEEKGEDDRDGKSEDRSYLAKKWKHVPDHALVPEHKHLDFLAKRRRGLPTIYGQDVESTGVVQMRKTKVMKADAVTGDTLVYEVLVPEGQSVEGEISAEAAELASVQPVPITAGTVIEGLGMANDEGVLVAEHLKPTVSHRRNRPPPKKKGGPGRGKKRVTFTNADGTTYTQIVPNATKIVPQPGQTVKHVAKGEEAGPDITAEQAALHVDSQTNGEGDGDGEGEGEDEGSDDEEGDDDDDREDGELSDEDAPQTQNGTPAQNTPATSDPNDTTTAAAAAEEKPPTSAPAVTAEAEESVPPIALEPSANTEGAIQDSRDVSSSPDLPLAQTSTSHSRSGSLVVPPPEIGVEETPVADGDAAAAEQVDDVEMHDQAVEPVPEDGTAGEEDEMKPDVEVEVAGEDVKEEDVAGKEVAVELQIEPEAMETEAVVETVAVVEEGTNQTEVKDVAGDGDTTEREEEQEVAPAISEGGGGNDDLLGGLEAHLQGEKAEEET